MVRVGFPYFHEHKNQHICTSRTLVCLKVQVPSYDPLHPISIGLLTCDPSVRGFIFAYIYQFCKDGENGCFVSG